MGYRKQTSLLLGVVVAFLTFVELHELLVSESSGGSSGSSGSSGPLAVALQVLTCTSFLIGMAMGSLLPRLLLGVVCGVGGALVLCGVVGGGGFVWWSAGLAVALGGISCR